MRDTFNEKQKQDFTKRDLLPHGAPEQFPRSWPISLRSLLPVHGGGGGGGVRSFISGSAHSILLQGSPRVCLTSRMLRHPCEATGTPWVQGRALSWWWERQASAPWQQPNSRFSLTLNLIHEAWMESLWRWKCKRSCSSNTMTQASVILKGDSLLAIFHLYYLPVRICGPTKLIFLNPNLDIFFSCSSYSWSSTFTSQFFFSVLHRFIHSFIH